MATLLELRNLFGDSNLLEQVEAATVISAQLLLAGTPTTTQKAWAAAVFSSPRTEASKALMFVLATNEAVAVATIQSATDSAIKAQVDLIVPHLVDAKAGV